MMKMRCVKTDDIMVNMLIYALRQVFRQEREQGKPTEVIRDLVLKLANHEERRLYFTDVEYEKALQAINGLRDEFIQKGRYTDGIDVIFQKLICAKYKRCASR